MEDVKNWLATKPFNYEKGIAIYRRYTRDPLLISLFKEDETDFKRTKLLTLMTGLVESHSAQDALQSPAAFPPDELKFEYVRTGKEWPKSMDAVLTSLQAQWKPVFAEMMNLQARIPDVAMEGAKGNPYKEQEAARMALRICELDDQCDEFYEQRDYYLKHNHLPAISKQQEMPVDQDVAWREMNNAERYVREYRQKLRNKPNDKRAPQWEQKILDFMKIITVYQKRFKIVVDE